MQKPNERKHSLPRNGEQLPQHQEATALRPDLTKPPIQQADKAQLTPPADAAPLQTSTDLVSQPQPPSKQTHPKGPQEAAADADSSAVQPVVSHQIKEASPALQPPMPQAQSTPQRRSPAHASPAEPAHKAPAQGPGSRQPDEAPADDKLRQVPSTDIPAEPGPLGVAAGAEADTGDAKAAGQSGEPQVGAFQRCITELKAKQQLLHGLSNM